MADIDKSLVARIGCEARIGGDTPKLASAAHDDGSERYAVLSSATAARRVDEVRRRRCCPPRWLDIGTRSVSATLEAMANAAKPEHASCDRGHAGARVHPALSVEHTLRYFVVT